MPYTTQKLTITGGSPGKASKTGGIMSSAIDCTGYTILRIIMPDPWDAAPISFQLSPDGVSYHDLFHTVPDTFGTYEVILPVVAPGAVVSLPAGTGSGVAFVKVRSGTRANPVEQSADREFTLVMEPTPAGIPAGPAGPQGLPGNTGPTGPAGNSGATGAAGSAGTVGATGAVGPTGSVGAGGPQGVPGPVGTAGPTGVTGPVGAQGGQGTQGALGPTGGIGAIGPTGPTGTFNLQGTVAADNAAAGIIGEVVAVSTITGVACGSNTTVNIATLALTAGDWAVAGVVVFTPVSTAPSALAAAISTTSATLPTAAQVAAGTGNMTQYRLSFTNGVAQTMQTGICRINVNAPTNAYLMAQGTISGGSMTATGYVSARRVR